MAVARNVMVQHQINAPLAQLLPMCSKTIHVSAHALLGTFWWTQTNVRNVCLHVWLVWIINLVVHVKLGISYSLNLVYVNALLIIILTAHWFVNLVQRIVNRAIMTLLAYFVQIIIFYLKANALSIPHARREWDSITTRRHSNAYHAHRIAPPVTRIYVIIAH